MRNPSKENERKKSPSRIRNPSKENEKKYSARMRNPSKENERKKSPSRMRNPSKENERKYPTKMRNQSKETERKYPTKMRYPSKGNEGKKVSTKNETQSKVEQEDSKINKKKKEQEDISQEELKKFLNFFDTSQDHLFPENEKLKEIREMLRAPFADKIQFHTKNLVHKSKKPLECHFCNRLQKDGYINWDALNVPLLFRFMTPLGRIRPRKETKICTKHQRTLSKTIKRAVTLGIFSWKKSEFKIYSPSFFGFHVPPDIAPSPDLDGIANSLLSKMENRVQKLTVESEQELNDKKKSD